MDNLEMRNEFVEPDIVEIDPRLIKAVESLEEYTRTYEEVSRRFEVALEGGGDCDKYSQAMDELSENIADIKKAILTIADAEESFFASDAYKKITNAIARKRAARNEKKEVKKHKGGLITAVGDKLANAIGIEGAEEPGTESIENDMKAYHSARKAAAIDAARKTASSLNDHKGTPEQERVKKHVFDAGMSTYWKLNSAIKNLLEDPEEARKLNKANGYKDELEQGRSDGSFKLILSAYNKLAAMCKEFKVKPAELSLRPATAGYATEGYDEDELLDMYTAALEAASEIKDADEDLEEDVNGKKTDDSDSEDVDIADEYEVRAVDSVNQLRLKTLKLNDEKEASLKKNDKAGREKCIKIRETINKLCGKDGSDIHEDNCEAIRTKINSIFVTLTPAMEDIAKDDDVKEIVALMESLTVLESDNSHMVDYMGDKLADLVDHKIYKMRMNYLKNTIGLESVIEGEENQEEESNITFDDIAQARQNIELVARMARASLERLNSFGDEYNVAYLRKGCADIMQRCMKYDNADTEGINMMDISDSMLKEIADIEESIDNLTDNRSEDEPAINMNAEESALLLAFEELDAACEGFSGLSKILKKSESKIDEIEDTVKRKAAFRIAEAKDKIYALSDPRIMNEVTNRIHTLERTKITSEDQLKQLRREIEGEQEALKNPKNELSVNSQKWIRKWIAVAQNKVNEYVGLATESFTYTDIEEFDFEPSELELMVNDTCLMLAAEAVSRYFNPYTIEYAMEGLNDFGNDNTRVRAAENTFNKLLALAEQNEERLGRNVDTKKMGKVTNFRVGLHRNLANGGKDLNRIRDLINEMKESRDPAEIERLYKEVETASKTANLRLTQEMDKIEQIVDKQGSRNQVIDKATHWYADSKSKKYEEEIANNKKAMDEHSRLSHDNSLSEETRAQHRAKAAELAKENRELGEKIKGAKGGIVNAFKRGAYGLVSKATQNASGVVGSALREKADSNIAKLDAKTKEKDEVRQNIKDTGYDETVKGYNKGKADAVEKVEQGIKDTKDVNREIYKRKSTQEMLDAEADNEKANKKIDKNIIKSAEAGEKNRQKEADEKLAKLSADEIKGLSPQERAHWRVLREKKIKDDEVESLKSQADLLKGTLKRDRDKLEAELDEELGKDKPDKNKIADLKKKIQDVSNDMSRKDQSIKEEIDPSIKEKQSKRQVDPDTGLDARAQKIFFEGKDGKNTSYDKAKDVLSRNKKYRENVEEWLNEKKKQLSSVTDENTKNELRDRISAWEKLLTATEPVFRRNTESSVNDSPDDLIAKKDDEAQKQRQTQEAKKAKNEQKIQDTVNDLAEQKVEIEQLFKDIAKEIKTYDIKYMNLGANGRSKTESNIRSLYDDYEQKINQYNAGVNAINKKLDKAKKLQKYQESGSIHRIQMNGVKGFRDSLPLIATASYVYDFSTEEFEEWCAMEGFNIDEICNLPNDRFDMMCDIIGVRLRNEFIGFEAYFELPEEVEAGMEGLSAAERKEKAKKKNTELEESISKMKFDVLTLKEECKSANNLVKSKKNELKDLLKDLAKSNLGVFDVGAKMLRTRAERKDIVERVGKKHIEKIEFVTNRINTMYKSKVWETKSGFNRNKKLIAKYAEKLAEAKEKFEVSVQKEIDKLMSNKVVRRNEEYKKLRIEDAHGEALEMNKRYIGPAIKKPSTESAINVAYIEYLEAATEGSISAKLQVVQNRLPEFIKNDEELNIYALESAFIRMTYGDDPMGTYMDAIEEAGLESLLVGLEYMDDDQLNMIADVLRETICG